MSINRPSTLFASGPPPLIDGLRAVEALELDCVETGIPGSDTMFFVRIKHYFSVNILCPLGMGLRLVEIVDMRQKRSAQS